MTSNSLVWNGKAVKARMRAAAVKGINDVMAMAIEHARQNHDWKTQSSNLVRSIAVAKNAHEIENGVAGTWGSLDLEYALIHELGGVIEPKNSKYLAVPITALARKAGSPRKLTNLAFVQSLKGQPMLVDSESGEVHYLLMKSVTIPARPFLRPAADATYPKLSKAIAKAWDRLAPGTRLAPSAPTATSSDGPDSE